MVEGRPDGYGALSIGVPDDRAAARGELLDRATGVDHVLDSPWVRAPEVDDHEIHVERGAGGVGERENLERIAGGVDRCPSGQNLSCGSIEEIDVHVIRRSRSSADREEGGVPLEHHRHPAAGRNRDLAEAGVANFIDLPELAHVQPTAVEEKGPYCPAVRDDHNLFSCMDFSDALH